MSEPFTAVVTGAASGIGAACAARFTAAGWRTVGFDRHHVSETDVSVVGDVRRVADCDRAIATAVDNFQRLDAVVNAAGVWTEGPAELTTEDEWDRVLDTNLKGTFFMCRAAIEPLRVTKGTIVNLSSDAGIQGNAGASVYCASKGGVSLLTKALALELAPVGVRVNAVCPGDVNTPMLASQAADHGGSDPAAYLARLRAQYPQGDATTFVRPDEVAELVWYLCQPHARAITGANVSIDNGLSAGVW
jgi:NAD(P)-dependent dehydrogenase (short-subunit alcohol dehydrogenase family)